MRLAVLLALIAAPVAADVTDTLERHIIPLHNRLSEATAILADAAAEDCAPSHVKPAFHTAYDAWIQVSHIHFGPVEDQGAALAMAYWPDPKDSTGKALGQLTAAQDPVVEDPASFAHVSVAAQGFTALERLLFEVQSEPVYACALTRAITVRLKQNADMLKAAWPAFAALMETAGDEGNTRFQSEAEVQRALYTSLSTGLAFLHDQRLGRPLGTYDRPRPRRAEARRSGRSLRHVVLSLAALEQLATTLSDAALPETRAAFAAAQERANALEDPVFAGVAEPAARFRVEALQQAVREVEEAVVEEIGAGLGVTAGFNALDGD